MGDPGRGYDRERERERRRDLSGEEEAEVEGEGGASRPATVVSCPGDDDGMGDGFRPPSLPPPPSQHLDSNEECCCCCRTSRSAVDSLDRSRDRRPRSGGRCRESSSALVGSMRPSLSFEPRERADGGRHGTSSSSVDDSCSSSMSSIRSPSPSSSSSSLLPPKERMSEAELNEAGATARLSSGWDDRGPSESGVGRGNREAVGGVVTKGCREAAPAGRRESRREALVASMSQGVMGRSILSRVAGSKAGVRRTAKRRTSLIELGADAGPVPRPGSFRVSSPRRLESLFGRSRLRSSDALSVSVVPFPRLEPGPSE